MVPRNAQTAFGFLGWLAGVPFCVLAAYLFHLAFERPFMSVSAKAVSRLVVDEAAQTDMSATVAQ